METITKYYQTRLGIDLNNQNHPISNLISLAKSAKGLEQLQIKQKLRMIGLALMELKNYDQKIYNFYIKKTVNNASFSLHGYIFEIIQCFNLVTIAKEKNMHFEFGDANLGQPDFIIDGCGIEATSTRFPKESTKSNADSKLYNKFREKNKKLYSNSNSILLIEATQTVHYANQEVNKPQTIFNEVLKKISEESNFGVVLVYVEYTIPTEENIFFKGTVYSAYGKNCSEAVKIVFQKITNGEFNTFDGTQKISPY